MAEELRNNCMGFSDLIVEPRALLVDGDPPVALHSALILGGPATLQENFQQYKRANFTLNQINQMLEKWRDLYFQVSVYSYLYVYSHVVIIIYSAGD